MMSHSDIPFREGKLDLTDLQAGRIDFPCRKCRYNLRGIEGARKTCPECGELNTVDFHSISDSEMSVAYSTILTNLGMWVWAICLAVPTICFPSIDFCFFLVLSLILFFLGRHLVTKVRAVPGWTRFLWGYLFVRILGIVVGMTIAALLSGVYADWIYQVSRDGMQSILTNIYMPRVVFCVLSVFLVFVPCAWPAKRLVRKRQELLEKAALLYALHTRRRELMKMMGRKH